VVTEGIEQFLAAVEQGRAAARRGDLLEHDEVVERIGADIGLVTRVRWTTNAADDLPGMVERIREDNPAAHTAQGHTTHLQFTGPRGACVQPLAFYFAGFEDTVGESAAIRRTFRGDYRGYSPQKASDLPRLANYA
jgi:hypothetical protein